MGQRKQAAPCGEWIRANDALRRHGIRPARLDRLVVTGAVRARLDPGEAPRYNAADVERVASAGRR